MPYFSSHLTSTRARSLAQLSSRPVFRLPATSSSTAPSFETSTTFLFRSRGGSAPLRGLIPLALTVRQLPSGPQDRAALRAAAHPIIFISFSFHHSSVLAYLPPLHMYPQPYTFSFVPQPHRPPKPGSLTAFESHTPAHSRVCVSASPLGLVASATTLAYCVELA